MKLHTNSVFVTLLYWKLELIRNYIMLLHFLFAYSQQHFIGLSHSNISYWFDSPDVHIAHDLSVVNILTVTQTVENWYIILISLFDIWLFDIYSDDFKIWQDDSVGKLLAAESDHLSSFSGQYGGKTIDSQKLSFYFYMYTVVCEHVSACMHTHK